LALDRNCWIAHYGLALMHLALDNRDKAGEHGARLEALVEPAEFEFLRQQLGQGPLHS
jgi:hypothetical protein